MTIPPALRDQGFPFDRVCNKACSLLGQSQQNQTACRKFVSADHDAERWAGALVPRIAQLADAIEEAKLPAIAARKRGLKSKQSPVRNVNRMVVGYEFGWQHPPFNDRQRRSVGASRTSPVFPPASGFGFLGIGNPLAAFESKKKPRDWLVGAHTCTPDLGPTIFEVPLTTLPNRIKIRPLL